MQALSRRQLLGTTAIILGGFAVTGATCNLPTQIPTYVAAIKAIGQQALLALPQLQAAGLSGTSATQAATIISQISTVGTAISDAATATQGQSILIQIEGYINALAPIVASFAALVPGGAVIGLIVAALPVIEFAVNMTVTLLTPQAAALATTAPTPPASARLMVAPPSPIVPQRVINAQPYLNLLLQNAATK